MEHSVTGMLTLIIVVLGIILVLWACFWFMVPFYIRTIRFDLQRCREALEKGVKK